MSSPAEYIAFSGETLDLSVEVGPDHQLIGRQHPPLDLIDLVLDLLHRCIEVALEHRLLALGGPTKKSLRLHGYGQHGPYDDKQRNERIEPVSQSIGRHRWYLGEPEHRVRSSMPSILTARRCGSEGLFDHREDGAAVDVFGEAEKHADSKNRSGV